MEHIKPNEYRKGLADDLRDLRGQEDGQEKAKQLLDLAEQTVRYQKAREGHLESKKHVANKAESSREEVRLELSKEMRRVLGANRGDIERFAFFTSSKRLGGGYSTDPEIKSEKYDSRYKEGYELYNVDVNSESYPSAKNGYVYYKPAGKISFFGYLGRTLHTPDRIGNFFNVTIKFKKDSAHSQQVIDSVRKTFDTLETYYSSKEDNPDKTNGDLIKQDLKNIAKEGLPVLEALRDTVNHFANKSYGRLSIDDLIEEYKEMILEK